jgi:hypothetical protein
MPVRTSQAADLGEPVTFGDTLGEESGDGFLKPGAGGYSLLHGVVLLGRLRDLPRDYAAPFSSINGTSPSAKAAARFILRIGCHWALTLPCSHSTGVWVWTAPGTKSRTTLE